ncbi:hypothetical protein SETIT_9G528000v2 [Setaria italica]|uniref:Fe2OG dioxygenase domain-containing protein n=1 Tax=Setaria italica TaxID=4555 RepID=A0A368SVH0_SETIT|nr:hypothetical protein SETIT_9G528000v2 [Setaria italica]
MALPFRRALVAVLLLRLALGEVAASPTRVVHWLHRRVTVVPGQEGQAGEVDGGGRESGKNVESGARTSSGVFLTKKQDEVIARIEDRIAAWTFLPPEHGEPIQVPRYKNGEKYEPHFDYFSDKQNQAIELAVLVYLSDVKMGGETIFPNSEDQLTQEKDHTWSECARLGYAGIGDALLFFSLHPNTTTDTNSLHGSCPVIEGEKWSATKWIHVRSFGSPKATTGECRDKDDMCPKWADAGECAKNPEYMVGTRDSPGSCVQCSCKLLNSMADDQNKEKLWF